MLKNKRGLSLVELLVTALLLGIGLAGIAGMFTVGVISNRKAANITAAANRANQEMERLKDGGFFNAVIDYDHYPYPDYTIISSTRVQFSVDELQNGIGYIDLDLDPEAEVIDPNTSLQVGNLKQATITITWGGGKRVQGSYTITSLIANRPV